MRPSASALGWLSLAALIAAGGLGVTALLKRADVAASERDRLIHAQIRQVSETTALTLRQMDQGGRALMVALLRRVAELPDTQDESRVHGTLHTLVRDHPEVRELRARRGDERWVVRRGAPPPPGTPPPELAADAGRAPPRPWIPTRAVIPSMSLRRGDADTSRETDGGVGPLEALVEGRLRPGTPGGVSWALELILDATPPLSPLTRAPGYRLGHLAIVGDDGAILWGPTQRYDDQGSGWLELDDAAVQAGCAAWIRQGSPADRLIPYERDGHIFAVGGRTPTAFEDTAGAVRVCVLMPRKDFAHLQ